MDSDFSISYNLHSQISVRFNDRYLMNCLLLNLSFSDEENPTLLLIDDEIVLLGKFLKLGECFLELSLWLNKYEIICIPSVPDISVSDSQYPISEKVFKVDVKESRTKGRTLIDSLLNPYKFITRLEERVFIQFLEELSLLFIINILLSEDLEQFIFFDSIVSTLEIDENA